MHINVIERNDFMKPTKVWRYKILPNFEFFTGRKDGSTLHLMRGNYMLVMSWIHAGVKHLDLIARTTQVKCSNVQSALDILVFVPLGLILSFNSSTATFVPRLKLTYLGQKHL